MTAATTEMTPQTQGFLSAPRKILIDGKWGDALSERTFPTFNPATGDVLCHVPDGQKEDIDRAVKAARHAFEQGAMANPDPVRTGKTPVEIGRSHRAALGGICSIGVSG